jgi:hypothetical protein
MPLFPVYSELIAPVSEVGLSHAGLQRPVQLEGHRFLLGRGGVLARDGEGGWVRKGTGLDWVGKVSCPAFFAKLAKQAVASKVVHVGKLTASWRRKVSLAVHVAHAENVLRGIFPAADGVE